MLENRVQRELFGNKSDGETGNGEDYIMRSFTICAAQQILLGLSYKEE